MSACINCGNMYPAFKEQKVQLCCDCMRAVLKDIQTITGLLTIEAIEKVKLNIAHDVKFTTEDGTSVSARWVKTK